MNNNSPDNWVPVQQSNSVGATDLGQWQRVDTDKSGNTAYDSFKNNASEAVDPQSTDVKGLGEASLDTNQTSDAPLNANKGTPGYVSRQPGQRISNEELMAINSPILKEGQKGLSLEQVKQMGKYPTHSFLNQPVEAMGDIANLTGDVLYSTFGKPLGLAPEVSTAVTDEESQLAKAHSIGAIMAGTSPFIVTAPLFPSTLLGMSANFALVSGLSEMGRQRMDESLMKPLADKAFDVAKETSKGALMGPIWYYSGELNFVARPVASALIRAGIRGVGTAALDKVYGDDLAQCFKDLGIMGALSLIFESPYLANTVLGRGVIARTNKAVYEGMFGGEAASKVAQTSEPIKIDPQASHNEIKQSILKAANTLAPQVPQTNKIAAATVILPDGTKIHGTSHEDALNKINKTKGEDQGQGYADKTISVVQNMRDKFTEGKDFVAGFTTTDGKTISREESKQDPYNLSNGESEDVKGLNESKFMSPPKELTITNPDTLKSIADNEGKIDINIIPGVPETAEVLQQSHQELKEKFAPYNVGEEGKVTAETLRENLGVLARNNDRLEAALSKAKKMFDKANKESSLDFIYRMEEGKEQETKELQKIAAILRDMLDSKRDEVIGLGTGKLENWIENYFPHVWEKPGAVGNLLKRVMNRRPFEGSKSFLKRRTIPTTREGVEMGFTPVSYNPIDSVMLKVREMERYIMAHRTIQALKDQGIVQFVRTGDKAPEDFVPIDDRFGTVTYKNEAKELVLAGKYMIQKDAGRILNNYLSPGLRGKSYIYDMYRGAGNTLNQFQLGISAFHLGFTSMDATISKFALGINKMSTGDFAGAVKEFGRAPFAPITNILQGRELLQAWYGADKGELTNTIADLMASAGGRAKMDKFYATGMKDSLMKSIKEGKIATAAFKVPFYIVEQVARPIMEYIVPRQKMGVFMDMMKMELERNPGMSHEQMRGIAQRAWNSVDNRMGQLVYDNLFWNHVTKDLAMASVRSLGWNLGTIRELGGGIKDVFSNVEDVVHGKATQMSYRTAYVMALPIVTGLYGALYQYLHTGQWPQELKDYFFPKNGAIDNKGQQARISLPTYMKDIYHYTTNPVQTVINKFSPVNNAVMEMLNNKDYYDVEIQNADDPIMQRMWDESKFLASQFVPFGFRNQGRDTRTSLGSKIEPFIGILPAPYDINMTAAEKEAYEFGKSNIPPGSRTKEQAQHSQAKSKLMSAYIESKDRAPLDQAVEQGVISSKERREMIKTAGMTNLQRLTRSLTFEQVNHLLKVATPAEKEEIVKILEKKKAGKESRGTWTSDEEALYDKTINASQ